MGAAAVYRLPCHPHGMVTPFLRIVTFLHRWLGVAVAAMLLTWFLSGIVMMYREYPSVEAEDRVARLPPLDPALVMLSADEAFARAGLAPPGSYVLLTSFDGRPVYASSGVLIYADDGTEQREADDAQIDRAAAAWTGQPIAQAVRTSIDEPDQWTLSGEIRNIRPLFKYAWPDGQHVYVDGTTGDVVQYTTTASRFWAYLGAIPHWLYFTPLRTQPLWFRTVVWLSLTGAATSILGLLIGAWMYSPRRRYRHAGAATSIPYRGWKRWHMVAGLALGVFAVTWTFSGWLTMGPFPIMERVSSWFVSPDATADGRIQRALSLALRGPRLEASAYAAKPPRDAIASVYEFGPRELEYTSYAGQPIYVLSNERGDTRIVPVHGDPRPGFDVDDVMDRLRRAGGEHLAELRVLHQYDRYYLDRHGAQPLPVIYARLDDEVGSRYYIDPRTATLVGGYSSHQWVERWLSRGLHSFEFPWLYNHRPLWDIVVISLLLAGSGLCLTSLVLAWRAMGRLVASLWRRGLPESTETVLAHGDASPDGTLSPGLPPASRGVQART